ncbi:hypothetical protein [Prauserella flavalba]|nr:hypothetical protein [Prauserella flavalba]
MRPVGDAPGEAVGGNVPSTATSDGLGRTCAAVAAAWQARSVNRVAAA